MGSPPSTTDEQRSAETSSGGVSEAPCPRCGAPREPDQEYCLQCGLRLPAGRSTVSVLAAAWRRALPWYPGDWIWPTLLAFIVAAVSAAVVIVSQHGAEAGPKVVVGTNPTLSATLSTPTAPEPTTPATTSVTTVGTTPAPTPAKQTLTAWPRGTAGYTVVLASVPASGGRGPAVAQGRRAISAGLTDVGVLDSSGFSSLHPGYLVVFSGVFRSFGDAQSAASRAHSRGYPSAYPRRITP